MPSESSQAPTPGESAAGSDVRPVAVARPACDPSVAAGSPLTAEHVRELELARRRAKRIRRAVGVARFNGWTVGFFAVLSLLIGFFSLPSLLIGVALAVVSYHEFAGARQLRLFDERAGRRLGFNQLGLGSVLIVYAVWSIFRTLTAPSPLVGELASLGDAAELVGSIESLTTTISLAVYGGLIVGTVIFQGGTAWYYFTRGACIRAYRRETPGWVLELDRAQGIT